MRKIIQYIPESIILSLLNLALLALFCDRSANGFEVPEYRSGTDLWGGPTYTSLTFLWYSVIVIFSFIIAFLTTKIKKLEKLKKRWINGVYTFVPCIIDLCFRSGDTIQYSSIIWIFVLDAICWILLRYEVDEVIRE